MYINAMFRGRVSLPPVADVVAVALPTQHCVALPDCGAVADFVL
jgi:hypothetical protein